MDLNKEIREIIHLWCGGSYLNRTRATEQILQKVNVRFKKRK